NPSQKSPRVVSKREVDM
ncbi:hypothetical protein AVEN_254929-1, partial [Araneus ventricosus]